MFLTRWVNEFSLLLFKRFPIHKDKRCQCDCFPFKNLLSLGRNLKLKISILSHFAYKVGSPTINSLNLWESADMNTFPEESRKISVIGKFVIWCEGRVWCPKIRNLGPWKKLDN